MIKFKAPEFQKIRRVIKKKKKTSTHEVSLKSRGLDLVLETKCRGKKERNEQKTPRINKVRSKKIIQLIRSTMTK